ncbi:MAG TPA: 1-deoxy-D-xylulose-5-phosphate synthase [Phycisphaerae bacterium]|nr:1-deoxy-D-xylulose-5-phosphate synthase [Phycisphaerae bacterium]
MPPRIMYIECKTTGLEGPARIGRVSFSNTSKTLYYKGRKFQKLNPKGDKANYFDVETGEQYWISGCKKRGGDRLYGVGKIEIDDDVREEYWTIIRESPASKDQKVIR